MNDISTVELWQNETGLAPLEIGEKVCSFLDMSTTSFGRATAYNTKEQQVKAEMQIHDDMRGLSRDVYAAFLLLPGTTDRARQIGIRNLLKTKREKDVFLNAKLEREILTYLIGQISTPRVLKLFDSFRGVGGESEFGTGKANNAGTRKLIFATLLGSDHLELWVVKYRKRLERILVHAWGRRLTSIIGSIVKKKKWNETERIILKENVFRYRGSNSEAVIVESLGFLFGKREGLTLPLLKAFVSAKTDLEAGATLPTEVLEGLRATYHSEIPKEEILKMKAVTKSFTKNERRTVQKRAKAAGVKVDMDPLQYDPVELYIYAFENGADDKILDALDKKAQKAAAAMPVKYNKIGLIVDASASMAGDRTQKLRPLAVALSLRDMLQNIAEKNVVVYCGGNLGERNDTRLIRPAGDTSLAGGLVRILRTSPDAVYVLSDGYENAPSGRFSDVMMAIREIGVTTPVFHLNPVFAAESESVRELCEGIDGATTMPVKNPTALGTTMLRGLVEADPIRGLNALVKCALQSSSNKNLALIGGA